MTLLIVWIETKKITERVWCSGSTISSFLNFSNKSAAQVVFSHGVASSAPIRTYGNPREGTSDSAGLKGSGYGDPQDLVALPSNTNVDVDEDRLAKAESIKKKKREYREPWVIIFFFSRLSNM